MWDAIKQLALLAGQILPLFSRRSASEDDDGTPSMRDVAIAQESGATASREGKLTARNARKTSP